MSIPALIIPVLNRFDLLERTLASIDHPIDHILVIDNSGKLPLDGKENMHVLHMPSNLGVAASWNLGIKCFPLAPYWLIGSNDNPWTPGALAQMEALATADNLVWSDRAWDCFTLGANVVKRVGLFDENYYPAYYEDTDYSERLRLHEMMDVIVHSNAVMDQVGTCTTIASDPELAQRNEITNQANREYFYGKIYGEDWDSWNWDLQRRIDQDWTGEVAVPAEIEITTFGSEDPHLHWPDINVEGRVVLDLGAGDFGRVASQDYDDTPTYWLSRGAKQVIAVDEQDADFHHTDERIEHVMKRIDGPEQITELFQRYNPDLVKVDIEGAETYLLNTFPDVLRIPKAYAIETHEGYLFDNILGMLKVLGYKPVWISRHETAGHVSVMYLERIF